MRDLTVDLQPTSALQAHRRPLQVDLQLLHVEESEASNGLRTNIVESQPLGEQGQPLIYLVVVGEESTKNLPIDKEQGILS